MTTIETATTQTIPDDADCTSCDTLARRRTCSRCGTSARITDCGHFAQPRPIAAGLSDGRSSHHDYCQDCVADYERATEMTPAQLTSFRAEAARNGDPEMVEIIDRALAGDASAIGECQRVAEEAWIEAT